MIIREKQLNDKVIYDFLNVFPIDGAFNNVPKSKICK
jgi:hypothetical protein